MNFNNFYNKTENRLKDSIKSLWATGDATMQEYLEYLFKLNPLLAEPVFQNTFPWEPSKKEMGDLGDLFNEHFIESLNKIKNAEFRFPSDRSPYKHQIESWEELLINHKSIAVTTGTGSGKTECFMMPVLYDLYGNCKNKEGVNAIFLYPLNALIGSQKKRIHAWCEALGGLKYAVYNGNTDDGVTGDLTKSYPELISRKQIRETPPQILFTNPTMLEYILIRNKDRDLLKNSEGKLRWILLDEAHTLTGSSASEMALLIRRVIDAFKSDIKNIRFAITSATVGEGNNEHLTKFMSDLCGIPKENVVIITGERVLNDLNLDDVKIQKLNLESIKKLRSELLKSKAVPLKQFIPYIDANLNLTPLEFVDVVAENNFTPVRGHFFSRGIGGVYVCTNADCNIHGDHRPKSLLGTMHTIASKNCDCGWPLLELVACRSCGNYMLEGELKKNKENKDFINQISNATQSPFEMEDDNPDDDPIVSLNAKILAIRNRDGQRLAVNDWMEVGFEKDGTMNDNKSHLLSHSGLEPNCPFCGELAGNSIHFRISSLFTNRILSDLILEETPEVSPTKNSMLWGGRKYISFTDSRQGTAKTSALLNIDSERNWLRAMVYHSLCLKAKKESEIKITEESEDSLEDLQAALKETKSNIIRRVLEKQITDLVKNKKKEKLQKPIRLSWSQLIEIIKNKTDLRTLFNNNIDENFNIKWKTYLEAMFFDQFARRLPRERSLENLGMVNIVYPSLDKAIIPDVAIQLNITQCEWQDLLKISTDYFIRNKFHFVLPPDIYTYSNSFLHSFPTSQDDFPKFEKKNIRPNRLALLILAGLGITSKEDISNEIEDQINNLLRALWNTISRELLVNDNGNYKLNLEEKIEFELSSKLYLCPVKQRLVDKVFRNISPWITGRLTVENIEHFKIKKTVNFPKFPYPFNLDEENKINHVQTLEWIEENSKDLREKGVWNDLHERIIDIKPLYLAGEHSAQQKDTRLKELEDNFEKGQINILNCSTTMEMGVDIGGISAVLMNNVPPGPANYLQRAGRAGRRSETKSLAFTICAPNPIGSNAFNKPTWALEHCIAPPMLSFNSNAVVIRHINAFYMGKFIQSDAIKGMKISERISDFFFGDESLGMQFSNWLMIIPANSYESEIKKLIAGTGLEGKDASFCNDKVKFNFNTIKNNVFEKVENFDAKLKEFASNYGENSSEFKAVHYRKSQFERKNAISFFAEEGFVPSAGIPTGIVDMDLTTVEDLAKGAKNKKSNPSFHITRALSEFSPGSQIVIDGWSYVSAGIITRNTYGNEAKKDVIQSCKNCGFQRIVENTKENSLNADCPHCGKQKFTGIKFNNAKSGKFTEVIEPVGFAVDIRASKSRKINENGNYNYIEPLLINIKPWSNDDSSLIDVREGNESAEILYFNKGKGDGFAVCLNCGRTEYLEEKLENHKRLRGGKNPDDSLICEGNTNPFSIRRNVILGGRYQTDFCEIRLKDAGGAFINDESLLYSLGVIFTKTLAEYLAIESQELSFGIKKYDKYATIFIFDTARGGAGYSSQFSFFAESVLKISLDKLRGCNCQNACTKCLVDRNSNRQIHLLDRNPAIDWLNTALDQRINPNIVSNYTGIKKILGNVRDDINKQAFRNNIKKIWLYASSKIDAWNPEESTLIKNLKDKIKVNFILSEDPIFENEQDKISFLSVKKWSSIFIEKEESEPILLKVASVKLVDGSIYTYYAEKFSNELSENWGTIIQGHSYRLKVGQIPSLIEIQNPTFGGSTTEVFINTKNLIKSNHIADLLLDTLKEKKFDLKNEMNNETFEIEYYDRYVKSPIACILLIQFIDRLKEKLNFKIKSFKVYGKKFDELRSPAFFYNNFETSAARNNFIESYAQNDYDIPNVEVIECDIPHYRFLRFKSKNKQIIIRPDAGIEYGWRSNEHIKYSEIYEINDFEIKRSDYNDILYTISIGN